MMPVVVPCSRTNFDQLEPFVSTPSSQGGLQSGGGGGGGAYLEMLRIFARQFPNEMSDGSLPHSCNMSNAEDRVSCLHLHPHTHVRFARFVPIQHQRNQKQIRNRFGFPARAYL